MDLKDKQRLPQIKITSPQTLQLDDSISSKVIPKSFGRKEDYIELHIYNNNNQLLYTENDFSDFTFPDTPQGSKPTNLYNEIIVDTEELLKKRGYVSGDFKIKLNILRSKVLDGTNNATPFTIKDISPSRKEIKLTSSNLSNTSFDTAVSSFISEIESSAYFRDFYLNLGKDRYALGVNLKLNRNTNKLELLVKVLNPLPESITSLTKITLVELITDPQLIEISLGEGEDLEDDTISLR